jgi:hypothetical protein
MRATSCVIPAPVLPDTAKAARCDRSAFPPTLCRRAERGPSGSRRRRARKTRRSAACRPGSMARATPMVRLVSAVSRRPAVSRMRDGQAAKIHADLDHVAGGPATSEVMAASRPAKALRSVDLPAFGSPTGWRPRSRRGCVRPRAPGFGPQIGEHGSSGHVTSGVTSVGTSSSAKSMVASRSASAADEGPRQRSHARPSAPERTRCAWRRCASVSASIRSARPSTCARSRRPFSSARRVNSPGSARRNPRHRAQLRRTAATTRATVEVEFDHGFAGEAGAFGEYQNQRFVEVAPPSRRRRTVARRGGGRAAPAHDGGNGACGPEIRITATPARPRAVGWGEDRVHDAPF